MSRRSASAVAPAPRRHFGVAMTVAAIAVFSVLAGTGASYAYWTASASRSVTASTGDVTVTVGGFVPGTIQNHVKETVGFVTVANTTSQNSASTTPATLSLNVARDSGSSTFAAAASVEVWRAAGDSSATCTLAAPRTSGFPTDNWNTGVSVSGTLAKGAFAVYCVRTTVGSAVAAAHSAGATSFAAKVTATLNVHNFTGAAFMAPSMHTAYIYPLGTTTTWYWQTLRVGGATALCADVNGGVASGAGTGVIPWACETVPANNRQWRFLASTTSGYFEIQSRSQPTLRMSTTADTSGSSVTVEADNGTGRQDWQLQNLGSGNYQLVNRATGYCLTSPTAATNSVNMSQTPCDGTTNQRFQPTLQQTALGSFACTAATTGSNRALTLSWTSTVGTFRLLLNGIEEDSRTGTVTGVNKVVNENAYPVGTYPYSVLDATGVQVASGTFTMGETRNFFWEPSRPRLTGCTS